MNQKTKDFIKYLEENVMFISDLNGKSVLINMDETPEQNIVISVEENGMMEPYWRVKAINFTRECDRLHLDYESQLLLMVKKLVEHVEME